VDGEVRMVGGPFDGEELDLDELFGSRRPQGLVIPFADRFALYDFDAEAECYRFRGWDPPERRPAE
jgi:hypothetical protein